MPTPPDPPSVLAIVVTHDGRRWIRDCLVALNTQTYPVLDVLVVDDSSPDSGRPPRLHRLAKRHLRSRRWGFLRTPRPLGFGGAINWALSRVRTRADLLLFIHDDAALDPTAIERMVERIVADDQTAIVGPKIVSWEDPDRLEEVGMAADRFGYPHKGLEEGEIDLGQHDVAAEVFYVTSTCMLVRHDVFRRLGGWDARMRAFAEDLDFCWRARLAGHSVRVEPAARARHAMGLATGRRRSPFTPPRYFIRRNRLRAIAKNASGIRLLLLIPQFVFLTFAEMIGFIVLRQPREIANLARALGWNLVYVPQTLAERARVQRERRVPDRKLRRLTVRESTRLRFYVAHQAQRLEDAWGRRAEFLSRQSQQARTLGQRLRGWPTALICIGVLGMLLGFRNLLWAPPASVGELLPYPDDATSLWRTFASPWHPVGLGQEGPSPPALALLGVFPVITLGATAAAQKLLIMGLGGVAFVGAYKLVSGVVDRPARVAAGVAYTLGAVGYAGVRDGALGALVFGAMAPFALLVLFRLTGWMRPPAWDGGRAIARLGFVTAVSAAFVPGSLLLYGGVAALLATARGVLEQQAKVWRGFAASVMGLAFGWVLLLPWSSTWMDDGGPLDRLLGTNSDLYAASWRDHGMASVVLGQTPDGPPLFGLALPIFGLIAVLVGEGQRRRIGLALWALIVAVGGLVAMTASGSLTPVVATPTEGGVVAMVAFAGLVGLGVGAFRLDLPRRGLGWVHAATLGGFALAVFLVTVGTFPPLWRGEWDPGRGSPQVDDDVIREIRSLMDAEAEQVGQYRALWVGEEWLTSDPSAALPAQSWMVTGVRGRVLNDLFERASGPAYAELERVVASIRAGATDQGGGLLGAFNVHLVILERGDEEATWLRQRDLALVRTESSYLMLRTDDHLNRGALYAELPPYVRALSDADPSLVPGEVEIEKAVLAQHSPDSYSTENARGPGVVFLAETANSEWKASIDDTQLERTEGGWGNAWRAPATLGGRLDVRFPRSLGALAWLVVGALAWIVVVGATFSRSRRSVRFGRTLE